MTREGEAVVVLPMRAPERVAAHLVVHHAVWLDRQVARMRATRVRLDARPPLAAGRSVVVCGSPRVLIAVDDAARHTLERSLRAEARRVLVARVSALAPVVGVVPTRVTVRAQRARWGSASRAGAISLNWRLILAPPDVLDYVVVHELAHLSRPGHGRAFWALVRRHAPQADGARRWLRAHHAELMATLD
ncbi:MAG: SprT family zinc-dependent metalloprotease [Candidatus Limnocylindrales bacterium]